MSNQSLPLPMPGEIHIWHIQLELAPDHLPYLLNNLASDERERADRLVIRHVRDRFIAGRGQLRQILASYLTCQPLDISFQYGPHGKPELLAPPETQLRFNLSHSADLALLGISCGSLIGVDIERTRRDRHFRKLAERFFSRRERQELLALPEEELPRAFYACWTRKEAYLKGIGTGLATPLEAFDVSLAPHDLPALLGQRLDPAETGRWRLAELPVPEGFRAAVATTLSQFEIITRTWHHQTARSL